MIDTKGQRGRRRHDSGAVKEITFVLRFGLMKLLLNNVLVFISSYVKSLKILITLKTRFMGTVNKGNPQL